MFWKIYFWFLLIIFIIGVVSLLSTGTMTLDTFADYEGLIESIALLLAAFGYAFRKKIFPADLWKLLFVVILVIWVFQTLIYSGALTGMSFLEASGGYTLNEVLITLIISVPAMVAMYRLGFKRTLG